MQDYVVLDERGRVGLKKFITGRPDAYLVEVDSDGVITLTPAVFIAKSLLSKS